jgi:hypothetical protein
MEILHTSDDEIRAWANRPFFPSDCGQAIQKIRQSMQHIQEVSTALEERVPALTACLETILQVMPIVSESKKFLFGVRAQILHVHRQSIERGADATFQNNCQTFVDFVDRVLQIRFPKPEFQITDDQIQTPTPDMLSQNIMDPITLEPLQEGSLYAFYKGHFVGSREVLQEMIQRGTRGSDTEAVFVPLQNRLIPLDALQWIRW